MRDFEVERWVCFKLEKKGMTETNDQTEAIEQAKSIQLQLLTYAATSSARTNHRFTCPRPQPTPTNTSSAPPDCGRPG